MGTAGVEAERTSMVLHEVIAGHDPDRIAVHHTTTGTTLTYRQLEHRANRLAHALHGAGVGPGDIVGLLLKPDLDLPVARLAVLKAGAAWMPLDPQHPPARLGFQVTDADAARLLTVGDLAGVAAEAAPHTPVWLLDDPALATRLAEHPHTPPETGVRPVDPAYLIYTSGSTGNPKGVLISHDSAVHYCHNAVDQLGITPDDRVPLVANPAFDVTIFDCFATLLAGATIVTAPREVINEPAALTTLLREQHVTLAYIPPAILGLLDPADFVDSSLRRILCAGATLDTEVFNRWCRPDLAIHNSYGPTETTVTCTTYPCPTTPLPGPLPIGTPQPHHHAYVLNKRLRPVPVGVAGQLYISGTGLAHGYLNRPTLTAERFLPDPFTHHPGTRMYATGDLARWRPDGQLEFLGRTDRQIKLRGQRIELAEIEHALTTHPTIRQCAVTLHGNTHLAAYLITESHNNTQPDADTDTDTDTAQLREHLTKYLPTYMIPTTFTVLTELPLTPNGKLDPTRLPDPTTQTHEYVPPQTPTQQWLADVWQELLGTERVGANDNFFDLGGNSLHGTQLVARIRDALHLDLDLGHLFTDPSLADLAARLDGAEAGPAATSIVPVTRDNALPCTPQQEGLWFLHRLDPSSSAYHMSFALRLRGALDIPALERVLCALVVRHEALRTRFIERDGLLRQVIDPPPATFPLPVSELAADQVEAWVTEQFTRPFVLTAGSLLRAAVARQASDEHVLVVVVHHIIADGWSLRILADELSMLYGAERGVGGAELKPLPIQPADHAAWQRGWLDGDAMDRQLTYWRERLDDLSTVDFPSDRPRPAQPTGAGTILTRVIPEAVAAAARAYARTHQVSFLAVMQAGLLSVVHQYTGQDDLTIGSIFSGRTRTEIEPVVGYFANTLVLRTDLTGEPTFAALVRRCHRTVLDAAAHQDVPFGVIVDALQPERVPGRNPLFQISLTLQPAGSQADLALGDVAAEPLAAASGFARFDLAVEVIDAPDGLGMSVEYSTELFDADRMERFLDHYTAALGHGVAAPDTSVPRVELMTPAQRRQVLHEWNPSPTPRTPGLLHEVTTGHDPDRVAVHDTTTGTTLTYRQVEHDANQLAHALRAAGIGSGDIVALLLNRGPELPAARLAVLKAGAAWMPLDPQHPPARLGFQVADADAPLLITVADLAGVAAEAAPHTPVWLLDDPALATRLAEHPHTAPDVDVRPVDPAYLIYTSGSTGTPKGVLISHHSAIHYCHNAVEQLGTRPEDRVPLVANPAFDLTIFDCFATLLAGATIVSASRDTINEPVALTALLREEHATLAYIPPAILGLLNPQDFVDSALSRICCAGATLDTELANRWSRPDLAIHNSYGPTETTVTCTNYPCPTAALNAPVPIGTALPNHSAYILDRHLRPTPTGITGQLYISGTGLAHGYLNRPTLTAERFLPDPFTHHPGTRMYATGDLARWRPDGQLEFLGRTDRQIKLRGQRIELAEIEHALTTHPTIRQCAVTLHGNTHLAAYLIANNDNVTDTKPDTEAQPDLTQLREHLTKYLPTYMIPTTFTVLTELPLTPNGKLDPTRLPDPTTQTHEYVPPQTPTQQWLAQVWQELLGTERVGANDNFFDLGGNSLHGTQLIARIRDALHLDLDLGPLFTNPTLVELAVKIDEAEAAVAGSVDDRDVDDVIPLEPDGTEPPLFFVHPAGGSVAHYVRLAPLLGDEQPFYAIEDPGLRGASSAGDVAERASRYVKVIRQVRPDGPYRLGGWSTGGAIALEMARLLVDAGEKVEIVIALDTRLTTGGRVPDDLDALYDFVRDLAGIAGVRAPEADLEKLRGLDRDALEAWALTVLDDAGLVPQGMRDQILMRMRVFAANTKAAAAYRPGRYDGRIVLLGAADNDGSDLATWQSVSPAFERRPVPGNHYSMLQPRHVGALADVLRDCLETAEVRR